MTDIDFVTITLAAVLAVNAFIAFLAVRALVTFMVTFWTIAPLFMREKNKAELDRERRRASRHVGH